MLLLNGALAVEVHVHRNTDPHAARRIAHEVAMDAQSRFGWDITTDIGFKYDLNKRTPIYFLPTVSAFGQPEIVS